MSPKNPKNPDYYTPIEAKCRRVDTGSWVRMVKVPTQSKFFTNNFINKNREEKHSLDQYLPSAKGYDDFLQQ